MPDLDEEIAGRAAAAGLTLRPESLPQLTSYLRLLGKWNRKINLTALNVEPADAPAIDRLIVEPLVAVSRLNPIDRMLLDVGSGGGSPGLPLKILVPELELILVESKVRKAAFLREAARELGLTKVRVENRRLEDPALTERLAGTVDVVTVRAVRVDDGLVEAVVRLLSAQGRLFFFGGEPSALEIWSRAGLRVSSSDALPGTALTVLAVMGRK